MMSYYFLLLGIFFL